MVLFRFITGSLSLSLTIYPDYLLFSLHSTSGLLCGLRITFCRCDSNREASSYANLSEQKKVFFFFLRKGFKSHWIGLEYQHGGRDVM